MDEIGGAGGSFYDALRSAPPFPGRTYLSAPSTDELAAHMVKKRIEEGRLPVERRPYAPPPAFLCRVARGDIYGLGGPLPREVTRVWPTNLLVSPIEAVGGPLLKLYVATLLGLRVPERHWAGAIALVRFGVCALLGAAFVALAAVGGLAVATLLMAWWGVSTASLAARPLAVVGGHVDANQALLLGCAELGRQGVWPARCALGAGSARDADVGALGVRDSHDR